MKSRAEKGTSLLKGGKAMGQPMAEKPVVYDDGDVWYESSEDVETQAEARAAKPVDCEPTASVQDAVMGADERADARQRLWQTNVRCEMQAPKTVRGQR